VGLITDRVKGKGNATGRVNPSVRPFVTSLTGHYVTVSYMTATRNIHQFSCLVLYFSLSTYAVVYVLKSKL